jgi:RHS repeat-associated protein
MYITPSRTHKNRRFTHSAYRYAFNSMEKDDEVKGSGNSYDYKHRFYDNRLGRFLSIDPLTSDFPYYSTYQFAGNKPIVAIDLDGLEEYIVVTGYPKTVNGIVLIRVSKQFYIDDLNKRHAAAVNNIVSSYDYRIGNAKGKSKKELIAQKENALSAAHYDYNQGLKKIDNNYSKTFYTKANSSIESQGALDGYIFAQGEMRDAMSANELEYFNGGGKILQSLAGSNAWDLFLNTDIVSAMPGKDPIGRIAYKAEAKWSTQTHFESNSSDLVISDQPFLDDIVSFLDAFKNSKILISGYTDSDGNESDNQKLSEDRAKSAMEYLVGQGIDASRIEIKGYGESKAVQGATDTQKAADRKITIEVQQ